MNKGEERDKSLKSFIRFINTNKAHPEILKPWLVYYYFDLIRPFESMNYAFSLVLLNHLMTKAFPNVPWFFEKFIFDRIALFLNKLERLLAKRLDMIWDGQV